MDKKQTSKVDTHGHSPWVSTKKGRFYFTTTLLPGSVYFIQLNRVGEDYALNIIAEQHELKIFDKKCFIERESPRIQAFTTEKLAGK